MNRETETLINEATELEMSFGGYGDEVHDRLTGKLVDITLSTGEVLVKLYVLEQIDGFIKVERQYVGDTFSYRLINTDSIMVIAVHHKESNA